MRTTNTATRLSSHLKSGTIAPASNALAVVPKKTSKDDQQYDLDLFLGELMMPATKDDVASMEHPLFSIRKGGDRIKRRYEHNGFFLEVTPSRTGSATIWDKDILIYIHSLMRQMLDRGEKVGDRFEVSAADMLRAIGRDDSGDSYTRLYAALDRLVGTTIQTNLPSGIEDDTEETAHRVFALVAEAQVVRNKKSKRLTRLLFKPSDWFRNQVQSANLLTINPDYFAIESGLHRRLYEICRKHCGNQTQWKISLELLQKKTGSDSQLYRFRFDIKEQIKKGGLPFLRLIDYLLVIADDDMVHVFHDDPRGRGALQRLIAPALAK